MRCHPVLRRRPRRRARPWTSSVLPPWEAVNRVRPCRRIRCVLCVESLRVGQSLICRTLAFLAEPQALASRGIPTASHERTPASAGARALATWCSLCAHDVSSRGGKCRSYAMRFTSRNLLGSARLDRRLEGRPNRQRRRAMPMKVNASGPAGPPQGRNVRLSGGGGVGRMR